MVSCSQCKTQNPPELDTCLKCHADLLPPPGAFRRIWSFFQTALVGLVIAALGLIPLIVWGRQYNMTVWDSFSILIMLVGLVVVLRGLIQAFRPAPIYIRYLERAARHAGKDPNQAMADFVHAVMLAPAGARPGMAQNIPPKLKTVIARSGNNLISAMSGYQTPEGVRKIVYSAYTTWARLADSIPEFGKAASMGWQTTIFKARVEGKPKAILGGIGKIFNELARDGLVQELGYCPKCKAVVTCDAGGHCSCDQKHGPVKGIVYVVPEEVELFNKRLMQAYGGS